MPELQLADLVRPHAPSHLPMLAWANEIGDGKRQAAAGVAQVSAMLTAPVYQDTLLLFGGDWYGDKLRNAAKAMGLTLTVEQFRSLEAVSVARSVNPRLLLTIARIKQAPTRFKTPGAWLKWLYLESGRLRAALGPFKMDALPSMRFGDGNAAAMNRDRSNTTLWALATTLGAGKTVRETQAALDQFEILYTKHFGAPTTMEASAAASAPFLYRPHTAALTGRGYYDHTYPSVDNGGSPNVSGMRDYLGRSNVNYDTHDGDDLWIPYGSNVYAPVSGPVLWADDQGLLIGYAGNTYQVYIGHLSARYVATGATVTRGQLIGKSGYAGGVDHIHLEVRHNGKQTDTMGWYGGGSDPCVSGPSPFGRYLGCEASVWLWADQSPPGAPDPTPAAPAGLRVRRVSTDSAMLAWEDMSSNETGFRIYTGMWDGGVWRFYYTGSAGANATTFMDTPLSCAADYYYEVSAYNSSGESSRTEMIKATTAPCAVRLDPAVFLPLLHR